MPTLARAIDLSISELCTEMEERELEETTSRELEESARELEERIRKLEVSTRELEESTRVLQESTRELQESTRELEERIRKLEVSTRELQESFVNNTKLFMLLELWEDNDQLETTTEAVIIVCYSV